MSSRRARFRSRRSRSASSPPTGPVCRSRCTRSATAPTTRSSNIYERVEKANGPRDRRFRIEHAQHLRAADIPRFAELGVIASMQPYHAVDDGRWAEKRLGRERAKTSYAWRSLLDAKATLAFGSDWDVAPISPILGIAAAVTRRTIDGKNPGWLVSRAADLGRGGAARLHRLRGIRRVRGEGQGLARARQARRLRRPRRGPLSREAGGAREDRRRRDRRRREDRLPAVVARVDGQKVAGALTCLRPLWTTSRAVRYAAEFRESASSVKIR